MDMMNEYMDGWKGKANGRMDGWNVWMEWKGDDDDDA